jgi:hypothetical protein
VELLIAFVIVSISNNVAAVASWTTVYDDAQYHVVAPPGGFRAISYQVELYQSKLNHYRCLFIGIQKLPSERSTTRCGDRERSILLQSG